MQQAKKCLQEPFKMGTLELKNRFVMAPLTRSRGTPEGVPNDLMKEMYAQRTGFGLIFTECSQISWASNTFPGSGGIFNEEQTEGWKKVVDAVHAKDGKIYMQIWHCGRQMVSQFSHGEDILSSSPIAMEGKHGVTQTEHEAPKEMTQDDIKLVLSQFKKGAENAKKAGFDGVELHAANGYLVDQFLRDGVNKRTDNYGGSVENRCRFMGEVLDELISVYGADRVGIRISPTGRFGAMYDSDPLSLTKQIFKVCEEKKIQFIEIKRHGQIDAQKFKEGEKVDEKGRTLPEIQIPDFFKTLRPLYNGVVIGNDGFDPESAQKAVDNNEVDLVSFGRLAINNPDLPQRAKNNWPLDTNWDYATFFGGDGKGYTSFEPYKETKE